MRLCMCVCVNLASISKQNYTTQNLEFLMVVNNNNDGCSQTFSSSYKVDIKILKFLLTRSLAMAFHLLDYNN